MQQQALLVSTDIKLKDTVSSLLMQSGFAVAHTRSTRATVQTLRNVQSPDLLIIDLALADDRIIDMIFKLKHHKAFWRIPILLLADLDLSDKLRAALEAGANRYIIKVFMLNNFSETVRELLAS